MTFILLLVAIVILLCVIAEKFSGKFGMPALILFMFIGMLFGSDGILRFHLMTIISPKIYVPSRCCLSCSTVVLT